MKSIHYLYIFIVCTLASSCDTLVNDVNKDILPSSDQQLVVHGYLSPQDTMIRVIVGVSFPVIGDNVIGDNYIFRDNQSIPGVAVSISNDVQTVTLTLGGTPQHYQVSTKMFPIVAGQTYKLKASINGQTVTSSCTIPNAITIKEIKRDSILSKSNTNNATKDVIYKLLWQDPANVANYYKVSGYATHLIKTQSANNKIENRVEIYTINFRENSRDGDLFTDQQRDGQAFASGNGRLVSGFWNNKNEVANSRVIALFLISADKNYYNYHKAVASYDGNNPFAEPSLIPSNIIGGLGCFAGYNQSAFISYY